MRRRFRCPVATPVAVPVKVSPGFTAVAASSLVRRSHHRQDTSLDGRGQIPPAFDNRPQIGVHSEQVEQLSLPIGET